MTVYQPIEQEFGGRVCSSREVDPYAGAAVTKIIRELASDSRSARGDASDIRPKCWRRNG